MKRLLSLLLLALLPGLPLVFAQSPEYYRRPYEILTGDLPRPEKGILWSAKIDGLDAWKVSGPGKLSLGNQFSLWDEVSGRLEFTGKGRVTLTPAPALVIPKPVHGLSLWVLCPASGKTTNLLQLQDATGKKFTLRTRNNASFWARKPWWCTSSFVIPPKAKFPLSITGIAFEGGKDIQPGDALHFDMVQTFQVNPVDYPPELTQGLDDYLTTADTMLPTPPPGDFQTSLAEEGGRFLFRYDGQDGSLLYAYEPRRGDLGEVTAAFAGATPFQPMAGAGLRARKEGVAFAPGDPEIQGTLLGTERQGDRLTARWQWTKGGVSLEFTYSFALKGRTLVVEAQCQEPVAEAFDCGAVKGFPAPRLFSLSYLNYRWDYPRLLVNDNAFVSLFVDWYSSNASEFLAGASRHGLQGAKVLGEDSASLAGGTLYLPVNRGGKNPLRERLFLTIAPTLEDVLPNIPHPRSKFFDEMKGLVCHTRMYEVGGPQDARRELDYGKRLRDYGLKDIFLRTHTDEFRTPLHSNSFTFSLRANQEAGGEAVLQPFFQEMARIFPRVAPYQDNRVIHPLAGKYFQYDTLIQWSDDTLLAGWDSSYQMNPLAQRMAFQEFTPRFKKGYPWNACYLDETTNTPPWGLVDYNPHTPGAATFRSVMLHYAKLLQEMRQYYGGPIWSEGNAEMFWAGCLDTGYAQCNEPDALPMPDFKIRKINPLENMNGYDLGKNQESVDYLVSAQIVYGNIGHLWGGKEANTILGPYREDKYTPQVFRNLAKSYYMMRQLQELYAGVPVEVIQYQCEDDLLTATDMLKQGRKNEGKVYLRYQNGLEIWVNRNPQQDWTVDVDGVERTLPPFGYAAVLPGQFLEYSALEEGHRVDYVSGDLYVYVDGRGVLTDFPELSAAQAYALLPEETTTRLVPVPFLEEESLGNLQAHKATPLDAEGNPLGKPQGLDLVDTGLGRMTVTQEAFQWRLE